MSIVVKIKKNKIGVPINTLGIGSTGIVVEKMYKDHVLLVTHNGIVSLTDPSLTWGPACGLLVEPCDCELIVK